MANALNFIPELIGQEFQYVQAIMNNMGDDEAQQFANIYRVRRKDPQTILLLTLVGFLGIAGVQRFIVDQIGLGILYVLTGGLCFIGTIVDLVNYKNIATDYNMVQAREIAAMVNANK